MFGHDDNNQKNDNDDKSTKIDVAVGQGNSSSGGSSDNSQSSSASVPSPDEFDEDTSSSFGKLDSNSSDNDDTAKNDSIDVVPSAPAVENNDLLDLKKEALESLSPLVGHLDQTPEEKFRTTMMMIQATDNQELVKTAYEAANNISDEKARAQALLDVVNEINYFTQPKDNKN